MPIEPVRIVVRPIFDPGSDELQVLGHEVSISDNDASLRIMVTENIFQGKVWDIIRNEWIEHKKAGANADTGV